MLAISPSGGASSVSASVFTGSHSVRSALLHELDDGEGDIGGSRTTFTIIVDDLCQRLHVLQPLKLPITLHVGMEEFVHLVDFFFHPSPPLSLLLLSRYFLPGMAWPAKFLPTPSNRQYMFHRIGVNPERDVNPAHPNVILLADVIRT
jgi:hypothetical protein